MVMPASLRTGELVPVATASGNPLTRQAELPPAAFDRRRQRQAIANQSNERKGTHSSERVRPVTGLVLFPLQPDQKGQRDETRMIFRPSGGNY